MFLPSISWFPFSNPSTWPHLLSRPHSNMRGTLVWSIRTIWLKLTLYISLAGHFEKKMKISNSFLKLFLLFYFYLMTFFMKNSSIVSRILEMCKSSSYISFLYFFPIVLHPNNENSSSSRGTGVFFASSLHAG